MICPACGKRNWIVLDSRQRRRGWVRTKRCNVCGNKFKTIERCAGVDDSEYNEPERKRMNIERIERLAREMCIKLESS